MPNIVARDRLIFALDVPSADEAERLLDRLKGHVSFVKVGLELYTVAGPDMVKRLVDRKMRIFLDLKFLDIEETVRRATARVASMGVEFLTVHANRKALTAAVEGRAGSALKLLAVTVLTNFDDHDLREMGIQRSIQDLVTARAMLASEIGCDGVIASGREATAIRQRVGPRFMIVTPGVRPAGKGTDDHARVTTPSQAIAEGADYLVIGRPIRDAADPPSAVEAIVAEMQAAFDARG
ncbi:orotidine-5'-phosphate decarboxylase [Candidatus Nitrospira inopinata]|jgi:orotidine-5'-phosphate decarboxylase|uniref:Orotidine 5'-phosphate decarboxylase n=1 Tax=Candidatus Nitrospira inopinata TaxID=1715989 RepID=A0A0S4KT81_9BACT|nr:orotidine-5'-phosphate decarboxylase [Candidatus Nitrospira inopinata]CUQ66392.1 Orotidine 5'-phosphate decarboxylase [Candidatus Nitrospira inopinata]